MANKVKNDFTVWVKLNALLGFKVRAETPEIAMERAREDIKQLQFIADGIEVMDSNEKITGVLEDSD